MRKYSFELKKVVLEYLSGIDGILYLSSEVSYQKLALSQRINNINIMRWMNKFRVEKENRLEQRLKAFTRHKLLIIDEIGYINLDIEEANLFF